MKDEQLDYAPFDPSVTHQNSENESDNPSNKENVYMNVPTLIANLAKPDRPELSSDRSPKPLATRSHDSGSNSPQMDNVYTNFNVDSKLAENINFPSSVPNNAEASLEMDEIYINENVDEVRRPSTSKPKPASTKVEKADEEPVSLVQDDIYCNDPAQDPQSESEQLYEVPEGGLQMPPADVLHQSDIYINANDDSIYQNM